MHSMEQEFFRPSFHRHSFPPEEPVRPRSFFAAFIGAGLIIAGGAFILILQVTDGGPTRQPDTASRPILQADIPAQKPATQDPSARAAAASPAPGSNDHPGEIPAGAAPPLLEINPSPAPAATQRSYPLAIDYPAYNSDERARGVAQTTPEPRGFWPRVKPRRGTGPFKVANVTFDPLDTDPLNIQPVRTAADGLGARPFFSMNPAGAEPDFADFNPIVPGDVAPAPPTGLATGAPSDAASGDNAYETLSLELVRGETLVDLLRRARVREADRNRFIETLAGHLDLRALRPGFTVDLTLMPPDETVFEAWAAPDLANRYLAGLTVRPDAGHRLRVRDHFGRLEVAREPVRMTTRLKAVSGEIVGNLYLSMQARGTPDRIITELANAFAYDIDFQREIFRGDQFMAIFEAIYDDEGVLVDGGRILYGRLSWRGGRREKGYYRFEARGADADYFDASGQSARRLLMKTPIDGARLSSGFGTRRHPILGYKKTHKGLDFAARSGTPIKATGDGVIERADRYGSYGNYIRIRHNSEYKTAYAHLKGFASGIRAGRRVRQGDIIGYVGSTGRSTGPHLHYEVHRKGTAVNPQTLKIATGTKLNGYTLAQFEDYRAKLDTLLAPSQIAAAQ